MQANRLPTRYNALNFSAPSANDQHVSSSPGSEQLSDIISVHSGARSTGNLRNIASQFANDENSISAEQRVALPVYCGYEEEELLSE